MQGFVHATVDTLVRSVKLRVLLEAIPIMVHLHAPSAPKIRFRVLVHLFAYTVLWEMYLYQDLLTVIIHQLRSRPCDQQVNHRGGHLGFLRMCLLLNQHLPQR